VETIISPQQCQGDILTITGSKDIDVNSISSGDSTAIQINDSINISGTVTANSGLVANGITYPTTDRHYQSGIGY
jgi:hypothetical protein